MGTPPMKKSPNLFGESRKSTQRDKFRNKLLQKDIPRKRRNPRIVDVQEKSFLPYESSTGTTIKEEIIDASELPEEVRRYAREVDKQATVIMLHVNQIKEAAFSGNIPVDNWEFITSGIAEVVATTPDRQFIKIKGLRTGSTMLYAELANHTLSACKVIVWEEKIVSVIRVKVNQTKTISLSVAVRINQWEIVDSAIADIVAYTPDRRFIQIKGLHSGQTKICAELANHTLAVCQIIVE